MYNNIFLEIYSYPLPTNLCVRKEHFFSEKYASWDMRGLHTYIKITQYFIKYVYFFATRIKGDLCYR